MLSIFLSADCICRFLYVIQYYIGNGFYVAIDYHAGLGQVESDRQTVSNPSVFQANWLALLTAIQSLSTYETQIKGKSTCLKFLSVPSGHDECKFLPSRNIAWMVLAVWVTVPAVRRPHLPGWLCCLSVSLASVRPFVSKL